MTRLLLHAGFHKTGTSSLQRFFQDQRKRLRKQLRFVPWWRYEDVRRATRRLGQRPWDPLAWLAYRRGLARLFGQLDASDPRPVLISWEGFSGEMPGIRGVRDYSLLPRLTPAAVVAARRALGRDLDVEVLLTTRAEEAWWQSVHAHQVKYTPLAEDYDTFRARQAPGPVFGPHIAALRARLPGVPVSTAALEDLVQRRFGPAHLVIERLDLPGPLRRRMRPVQPVNTSAGPELTARFLDMNRRNPRDPGLKAAKFALTGEVLDA